MICKLSEINLEVFVVIEASQDSINVAFSDVLVELDHESVQLIEVDVTEVSQINMREAGNRIEISLPLKLLLFFFNFDVIVQLLFDEPRQFKLNILGQLIGPVRRSLRYLCPKFHVIIR